MKGRARTADGRWGRIAAAAGSLAAEPSSGFLIIRYSSYLVYFMISSLPTCLDPRVLTIFDENVPKWLSMNHLRIK